MAGPTIIKLALFATTALALPYNVPRDLDQPLDLQQLSHLNPRGLVADFAPYPKFDAHVEARDLFGATSSVPYPTGTSVGTAVVPTGTAPAATGLSNKKKAKRDMFAAPPAPTGSVSTPTGWNPHATGFVPTGRPMATGTGSPASSGYPAPSGVPGPAPHALGNMRSQMQKRQFEGPRKAKFHPRWDLFAAFDQSATATATAPTATGTAAPTGTAPSGTMPPRPTASS